MPAHAAYAGSAWCRRDPELAAILPGITGPGGQFRHRQHINLAFYAVRRYGMPDAVGTICGWIRQIAAYERAPQKYHHTVSRAWVELVAHHVAADPDCADFDVFADRNPALLDKRLLGQALPVIDAGRRAGPPRLGGARPAAVPLVGSGQHGRLIDHPPQAAVSLAAGHRYRRDHLTWIRHFRWRLTLPQGQG